MEENLLRIEFELWYLAKWRATSWGRPEDKTIEAVIAMRGSYGDYRDFAYLHGCWVGYCGAHNKHAVKS